MQTYQQFLEQVRENNPDQYDNIMAIINRQQTLKRLHKRLKTELDSKEDALNSSKADCILYEKDVSDRIM